MDWGEVKPISTISKWSHNDSGFRGAQKLVINASHAATDPAWSLSEYMPVDTIDTGNAAAT